MYVELGWLCSGTSGTIMTPIWFRHSAEKYDSTSQDVTMHPVIPSLSFSFLAVQRGGIIQGTS